MNRFPWLVQRNNGAFQSGERIRIEELTSSSIMGEEVDGNLCDTLGSFGYAFAGILWDQTGTPDFVAIVKTKTIEVICISTMELLRIKASKAIKTAIHYEPRQA